MSWRPDWKDAKNYPSPKETSNLQWAWEFLRRWDEYDQFFQGCARDSETFTRRLSPDQLLKLWDRFEILKLHDPAENYTDQIGLDLLVMALPEVAIYHPIEEKNNGESNTLSAGKLGEVVFRFNVLRPLAPQLKWAQKQATAIGDSIGKWSPPQLDGTVPQAHDNPNPEVEFIAEKDFQRLKEASSDAIYKMDYMVYAKAEDTRKYKSKDYLEWLRILDGESQGVSLDDIATLLDNYDAQRLRDNPSTRDSTQSKWRKKQRKASDWCKHDYKLLVAEEINSDYDLESTIREKNRLIIMAHGRQLPSLQEQLTDQSR